MSTLGTAARNAACDAVVDLLDVGGAGSLVITTSEDAVLVTLTLPAPAFGAAAAGVATANAIDSQDATGAGTAAKFFAKDNAEATVFEGTVGEADADMIITNADINIGDPISVTSWTHTQPAS